MQVFYGFSFKSGNKKHSQNESANHLKNGFVGSAVIEIEISLVSYAILLPLTIHMAR